METNRDISASAFVGRIFWMMAGPLCLALLAFHIIQSAAGWATWADLAYLTVLVGIMVARWVEYRGGSPRTAEGQPATWGHLRRYVAAVIPFGLGVWVMANVIGNHLLNR
jgi:hypothetical protein